MHASNNDENEESPPPPVLTHKKKTPSTRRARLAYAGQDEDEYDREQLLIKEVTENIHESSMKTIHAIVSNNLREAVTSIQKTGRHRVADRLKSQAQS